MRVSPGRMPKRLSANSQRVASSGGCERRRQVRRRCRLARVGRAGGGPAFVEGHAAYPRGGRRTETSRPSVNQRRADSSVLLRFLRSHDHVDHAVLEQELGRLEAVRQVAADGLLDHPRPGEADQGARLGDVDVAERARSWR